jgi:ketosteroid isomerase-like protein
MSTPYPTKSPIFQIFSHLATGDAPSFYAHVADDISWTVMGTSALSGHYSTEASFLSFLSKSY